jgi:hypothetical protein
MFNRFILSFHIFDEMDMWFTKPTNYMKKMDFDYKYKNLAIIGCL